MDTATIFGLIGGFLVVAILGVTFTGGNPLTFINLPSIFITIGGSIAAIIISQPWKRSVNSWKIVWNAFKLPRMNEAETILTLVSFSEKARREGLLALEDDLEELQDDFLRKGLQLVVDGTDPELVKKIMNTELDYVDERHDIGRQMFDDLATFSPAFGMIGTLIGLILMLATIEDKSMLGKGMATALITTYYGMILAYLLWMPLSNKLRDRNRTELMLKQIMLEGTLAIQSGDNPRIVQERLISYLPPSLRPKIYEETGKK